MWRRIAALFQMGTLFPEAKSVRFQKETYLQLNQIWIDFDFVDISVSILLAIKPSQSYVTR